MSATSVLSATEFQARLERYLYERSEEWRAVRVGDKEVSEQAEIVRRYADLFSREQLDALQEAEQDSSGDERELLYRLRKTCESGLISSQLAEREDELENRLLAERVTFQGEAMPLRNAQAKLAVLPSYADREELGLIQAEASAKFNDERLDLLRATEDLAAEYSGIADAVERNEEEKDISLRELSRALKAASDESTERYRAARERWFTKLLGEDREELPSSYHTAYMRRLSPLEATYTKERATAICLQTLEALGFDMPAQPNIKLDLDDRPQKSPRACVIASDPPKIVHLITRAQGGLHDYQAFLHEAGHALHYAGCDPELPYVFRRISRDHALTEIYSYIIEAITREPAWHEQYFGLSAEQAQENAEATTFLEALLYRRYEAKLRFELDFWSRFTVDGGDAEVYERCLTEATGIRYRRDNYLSDMDAGFYSADYLRAWIRSAQLRSRLLDQVGDDWWRNPATGELLTELFREGTKPSSEEIAGRLEFEPLDTKPLLREIGA
ncbi:MAG: hypothetical protein HOQ28_17945 [Thermoleophilia bacterium]|nr:hypothetical protein [Thermoleophilia bacterium]